MAISLPSSTTLKATMSNPSSSTISMSDSSPSTHFPSLVSITAIIVMVLIVVIAIFLIYFYKRHQRSCKMSPILQFEVMHSRVVVVDADGKSVAGVKRNSSVSSNGSTSSGKDAKNNKSKMIQVLQYNNNNTTIEPSHSKEMYYEYL
ncbi:27213_t:CDS:1 [Dentiscutata erythropus]|uniref:27213_t:CDS:1 n=1 Tax=Dentiscutata erythropus TaxID=1348616 RepID=A0A9N9JIM1_9GLOM|nr:27213_t:CDS:1 [Dentiscutata erythropus]